MRGLVISGALTALLGAWAIARGEGVGARNWDFLDAKDDTFGDAGKEGVWTKADSVTYFDALSTACLH